MGAFRTSLEALSPTAYWRLDETSGTVATDSSGNGNNGTYSGSYTQNVTSIVPIAEGTAVTTNHASEGGINLPTGMDPGTNEWCLVCFVSFTGTDSGFIIRHIAGSNLGPQVILNSAAGSGTIRCRNSSATDQTVDSVGTSYNDGNAHFVVAQRRLDGSQWKQEIYVDGVLDNSKNLTGAINLASATVDRSLFYASAVSGFTLTGTMDEIAFFKSSALTPTQIADLWAAANPYHAIGQLGINFANSGTAKLPAQAVGANIINVATSGVIKTTPQHTGTNIIDMALSGLMETNFKAIGQLGIDFLLGGNAYLEHNAIGQLGMVFTPSGIASGSFKAIGQLGIVFTPSAIIKITPQALGLLGIDFAVTGQVIYGVRQIAKGYSATQYHMYLNGIELPIKSFQYRMFGDRKFGSVVVPNSADYLSFIEANIGQDIVVKKHYIYLDGSVDIFDAFSIPLVETRLDQGGRNNAITLLGNDTYTLSANPHNLTVLNPVFRSVAAGLRRIRCELDPRVVPGDTITVGADTFVVAQVVWYVGPFTTISEFSE